MSSFNPHLGERRGDVNVASGFTAVDTQSKRMDFNECAESELIFHHLMVLNIGIPMGKLGSCCLSVLDSSNWKLSTHSFFII